MAQVTYRVNVQQINFPLISSLVARSVINPQADQNAVQLGVTGLMAFRNALAAMQEGDWGVAEMEMLDNRFVEDVKWALSLQA